MQLSSKVYLGQCSRYRNLPIKQFVDCCFSGIENISWKNATILLKPNLISSRFSGPACTDPRFIKILAEWFVDHGGRVSVGDSPAIGSANSVLRALQVDSDLKKQGVEILDFTRVIKKKLDCGIEVGLAAEPLEFEYFINVPKVKAHSQLYVTLAVKNVFGIVKGMRKSLLHMRHGGVDSAFTKIILDLLPLLPPNFSIIDGIEAMSRQGPLHGDRLKLGLIGFAEDPVALDTSLIEALRLYHKKSKLWNEANRRKYKGARLEEIEFPLLTPDFFHSINFEAPSELSPIRFNPFRFLKGNLKRLQSAIAE